ncbi:hypothetical protein ES708_28650 [subsurface metagenome]
MKRLFMKRWLGIPFFGIILSVVMAGAILAATWLTVTQTITQEIEEPYVPPEEDYGSITALDLDLSKVDKNSSFSRTLTGAVVVELGPDGEGKALAMVCNPDPKYTLFDVTITLKERPEGSEVPFYGLGITGGAGISIDLDQRGTYIFDLKIAGKAGSETGTAESTIIYTLEDSTTPPREVKGCLLLPGTGFRGEG